MVIVYDTSKILFVNKDLAEHYIIDSKNITGMYDNDKQNLIIISFFFTFLHISEMCRHNKNVANKFGFPDIAQIWSLAELFAISCNELESDEDMLFHFKTTLESL